MLAKKKTFFMQNSFTFTCSFIFMALTASANLDFSKSLDLTQHQAGESPVHIEKLSEDLFEWSLPDGKVQTMQFNLAELGINPADYDEFRFDIMPLGSQVSLHSQILGLPEEEDVSSWYLKFKTSVDEWSEGRYDLNVDDDGIFLGRLRGEAPAGTMILRLNRRILGLPGEPKWRRARIRNPRFVKLPVRMTFDYADTEVQTDSGEVAYIYSLKLSNRTDSARTVTINPDSTEALKHFRVEAPAALELGANEEKTISIRLFMSRQKAMAMPPLYAEAISPQAVVEGLQTVDAVPIMGYRHWPLWAAVPVFNQAAQSPVEFQAFLDAREKVLPGIRQWREAVVRKADTAMTEEWIIPKHVLPGHTMSYRCNDCRVYPEPLGVMSFHRHQCPECQKIFEDDPVLDAAYVGRYYNMLSKHVEDCGLAYLLTGERSYAQKALDILTAFAAAHDEMPVPGRRSTSGGSTLGSSTLLSSYVLPHLAIGFRHISAAELDEDALAEARTFLINEALNIMRHSTEYSNQTAEHFRAYGTVGLAAAFWPPASEAIHGEFGWHEMVEYAFSEDGIGHEAGAYHRSIFMAMNAFAEYAFEHGLNLYTARFKRVFDGSVIAGETAVPYEVAYRVYRDSSYLGLLKEQRQRMSEATATRGILGLADPTDLPAESKLMQGAGYVFLTKGNAADFSQIRLNYKKTFDRTERDRFTTFLYRNTTQVDGAVGRIIYSSPHSSWMYQTAAHNAIVVNGAEQQDVEGLLLAYNPDPNTPVAAIQTDPGTPFYDGVQQIRAIALIEDAYIVIDQVTAAHAVNIDRYQYGQGTARLKPAAVAVSAPVATLPEAGSFSDIHAVSGEAEYEISFENALNMRLVSDAEMIVYKALTVGSWQAAPREVTWGRVEDAVAATFAASFRLHEQAPQLQIVKSDESEIAVEMTGDNARYMIRIQPGQQSAVVERLP